MIDQKLERMLYLARGAAAGAVEEAGVTELGHLLLELDDHLAGGGGPPARWSASSPEDTAEAVGAGLAAVHEKLSRPHLVLPAIRPVVLVARGVFHGDHPGAGTVQTVACLATHAGYAASAVRALHHLNLAVDEAVALAAERGRA